MSRSLRAARLASSHPRQTHQGRARTYLARLRQRGQRLRRLPVVLRARAIYIVPTRRGLGFAGLLVLMLIGAINYANTLGYALSFLLASVGLVAMVHTWRNLHGLRLDLGPVPPVFAGESLRVPLVLDNQGQPARHGLQLRLDAGPTVMASVAANSRTQWRLSRPALRRGRHPLGTLWVSTCFPLGLFRAWSRLPLAARHLVYPPPSPPGPAATPQYLASAEGDRGVGSDDFAGLRAYHPGDSLRHVNWKAAAREQPLTTKQFGGDRAERLRIDWAHYPGLEREARLSRLVRAVLDAEAAGHEYQLVLPGQAIGPARGSGHRARCLEALALFEVPR